VSRKQQHLARIQYWEAAADHFRQQGSWQDLDDQSVYVQFVPLAGKEYFQAQQVEASTSHRVRIHYRSDVTPKMRLRMAKPGIAEIDTSNDNHYRIFQIDSVINLNEANRTLELIVTEKVGEEV
jgi:SPP1 family predicted phage head-tail adaptor